MTYLSGGGNLNSKQVLNRALHIDIIKGWAMLTIIIFHCSASFFPNTMSNIIGNPWNVPVFFIIGGFFLKMDSMEKPKDFVKGKLKRLYLPATIIYGLNVLLHNVYVYIGWYPLGGVHPASGKPYELYDVKQVVVGLLKVFAAGGSGELTMGAMWFLYTLLYAFIGLVIIYTFISILTKDNSKRFQWMTIMSIFLAAISCVLSQKYNITISRFSTALTAMFLIWWGMIINKKWQWKYDQWWVFIIAIIIFVHCVLMHKVRMVLAHNCYQDLPMLIVGSTAAIYIWGFIGRKIENNIIGKFLAIMGRESLYLMAFHIIGFFICNTIMVKIGFFSINDTKGLYTFNMGNNGWLLLAYVISGIVSSFTIIYTFRGLKELLLRITRK